MGWLIVSTVGVIADLASQINGPSPKTTSPTSRSRCADPTPHLTEHDALVAGGVEGAHGVDAPPG